MMKELILTFYLRSFKKYQKNSQNFESFLKFLRKKVDVLMQKEIIKITLCMSVQFS